MIKRLTVDHITTDSKLKTTVQDSECGINSVNSKGSDQERTGEIKIGSVDDSFAELPDRHQ